MLPFAIACCVMACFAASLPSHSSAWQTAEPPQPAATLTNEEAIQRIDAAVKARVDEVSGYSVQELYSIYRNGEASPSAQVTVKTVYTRGQGKEYTPVSATGSSFLRSIIIDKILAEEKEMALAANRETVAITSANYKMQLFPGTVSVRGRECIVMNLTAKRKATSLFNGKGWFDAKDFTLVHLEGAPAQSPSVFAGDTTGKRDYDRIEGFSMATHSEMHSHSFLFGDTVMKIEYTGYQIEHGNEHGAPAVQPSAPSPEAPKPAPAPPTNP